MSSFYAVLRSEGGSLGQSYDRPIRLNGEWEVALTHLNFPERGFPVFVFCSLVDYSYIDNMRVQLLDYWNTKNFRVASPIYSKVMKKRFSDINVNIRRQSDYDDLPTGTEVTCVLHFRKV